LPIVIKIDPYNFELYRFKLGAFFLRHSVDLGSDVDSTARWRRRLMLKSRSLLFYGSFVN